MAMNVYKFAILIIFFSFFLGGCQTDQNVPQTTKTEQQSTFDIELHTELGADDYGMRKYVMAFLKAGPNRDMNEEEAMEIQRSHMDNIRRMAENGDLVLAGPFLDGGELRGIYIFNVESVEEAKELTETDPAVQAGRLVMELHPWYGSAALLKVNDIHQTIARESP